MVGIIKTDALFSCSATIELCRKPSLSAFKTGVLQGESLMMAYANRENPDRPAHLRRPIWTSMFAFKILWLVMTAKAISESSCFSARICKQLGT